MHPIFFGPNNSLRHHYEAFPLNQRGGLKVRNLRLLHFAQGVVFRSEGIEQNHYVVQWFE